MQNLIKVHEQFENSHNGAKESKSSISVIIPPHHKSVARRGYSLERAEAESMPPVMCEVHYYNRSVLSSATQPKMVEGTLTLYEDVEYDKDLLDAFRRWNGLVWTHIPGIDPENLNLGMDATLADAIQKIREHPLR